MSSYGQGGSLLHRNSSARPYELFSYIRSPPLFGFTCYRLRVNKLELERPYELFSGDVQLVSLLSCLVGISAQEPVLPMRTLKKALCSWCPCSHALLAPQPAPNLHCM